MELPQSCSYPKLPVKYQLPPKLKEVASKFVAHGAPLSRFVSILAKRLLSISYFSIYYFLVSRCIIMCIPYFSIFFLASRCIIMPFWQFYSLESFYTDRKILSCLRSSPARMVLVQLKRLATSRTATSDFM